MPVPDLHTTIKASIEYAIENGIELPDDLIKQASRVGALKAIGRSLAEIRAFYHDAITDAMIGYFESSKPITTFKNQIRVAMVNAFLSAFEMGWVDGGQKLPVRGEALDWYNARVDAEMGFIAGLFVQAKEMRAEGAEGWFDWVNARADGYVSSVDGVYNAAMMYAKKGQMLTWHLGRTEQHCDTCAKLNGGRHRASWYLARNYIPRQPGAYMDCGGYRCDCSLTDEDGNEVTI